MKIYTAHQQLEPGAAKRLKQADKMYKHIAAHIPFNNNKETNQAVYNGLAELLVIIDNALASLHEEAA